MFGSCGMNMTGSSLQMAETQEKKAEETSRMYVKKNLTITLDVASSQKQQTMKLPQI